MPRGNGSVWETVFNPEDFAGMTIFRSNLHGGSVDRNDQTYLNAAVKIVPTSEQGKDQYRFNEEASSRLKARHKENMVYLGDGGAVRRGVPDVRVEPVANGRILEGNDVPRLLQRGTIG